MSEYEGDAEAVRRHADSAEADRRKREVGMAEPGTEQYRINALYVLGAYTYPNRETREKIKYLEEHPVEESYPTEPICPQGDDDLIAGEDY